MARVSIVSGAYNIADNFAYKKAISSILSQSFSNFEWIICDDGSTDNTWEFLCECTKNDPRIKLIQNEKNMGLAYSLNRCIEIATGEYIARQDLDDYSDVDRLKKQVKYLDKHPEIALLGTQAYLFDENGIWGKEHFPACVTKKDFLFTSPYQHGAMMMRKDALLEVGSYRVCKATRRCEDYDLFMTMHTKFQGANLDEFLYYFCEDTSSKKRRKYKYRIDEMKVRFRGFRKLKLMPKGFFYAIKPIFVGLIPKKMLDKLKKKRKRREEI